MAAAAVLHLPLTIPAPFAMNNEVRQHSNTSPVDSSPSSRRSSMVPRSPLSSSMPPLQQQQQQRVVLFPRASLIDNTLARVLSMKRARGSPSPLSCSDLPQPPIKKSKSDSSIMSGSSSNQATKLAYKNSRSCGSTVKIYSSGSSTPVNTAASSPAHEQSVEDMCPYTFIRSVLVGDSSGGDSSSEEKQDLCSAMQPLHETEFLRPTQEEIDAYSNAAVAAVRTSDVDALRRIHGEGQTLRCCNRFGESLLHVACRRSNADVVSFLLKEANVSPRIRDDYGRTPLHDACWRGSPEYDIVELLLAAEPKLAFVKDVRGHRPFQYARREHWGAWRNFLDEKRDLILS